MERMCIKMLYFLDVGAPEYIEVTKQQFIEIRKRCRFDGYDELYRFIGLPGIPVFMDFGHAPICTTRVTHKLAEDGKKCVILEIRNINFMRNIYCSNP